MKWLVGPRQIGKSSKIRQLVFESHHKRVAIISPTTHMAVHSLRGMSKFLAEKNVNYVTDALNMTLDWDNRTVHFIGAEFFERRSIDKSFRNIPKFIEDAEQLLEQFFGTVLFTSATGPNYKWKRSVPKEYIEQAFHQYPPEVFDQLIRGEWTDEEHGLENHSQLQNERGPK